MSGRFEVVSTFNIQHTKGKRIAAHFTKICGKDAIRTLRISKLIKRSPSYLLFFEFGTLDGGYFIFQTV